jgi:putative ABC transport system permease protein
MLKNNIKIAWRSLLKSKFYSLINVTGLAVGLAAGILLLLWVQNELSYDTFHPGYRQVYKVSQQFTANGQDITWTSTPAPLKVFGQSNPQIEATVRVAAEFDQNIANQNQTKIFDGNRVMYVDENFFSIFKFNLLQGKKSSLFPDAHSVVLTHKLAAKYFGDADAVGQIIRFHKELFKVTGITDNIPENSSFNFDAIIPMSYYAHVFTRNGGNGSWKTIDEDLGNSNFDIFVKLKPNADPQQVARFFTSAFKIARGGQSDTRFNLQPLADMHLISADGDTSRLRMVQIFMLVVVLLLAIASINYVNLSTARSLVRAKEVSVRKIVGAQKQQLFFQFLTETSLLFVIAVLFAVVLIYLFEPLYNQSSGKSLAFDISNIGVLKSLGLAIGGTLLASSIYPAVLLSSFKPLQALKGKITSGVGITTLRKGLVVFQFAISVVLLVCTLVMGRQLSYIKTKDVGYNKSYVFSVPLTQELADHVDAVKAELKKEPGIVNVASSSAYDFSNIDGQTGDLDWPEKTPATNTMITQLAADRDLIPTMGIHVLEGSNFTGTPADSSNFILNETAVKKMGLKNPVGRQISLHNRKGTIIGVVKDFNFKSLKEKITPLIFFNFWNNRNILYVRTTGAKATQAIAAVGAQYKQYAGNSPFGYHFLDQTFDAQYKTDERAGVLFNVFAGIAIFISCLGLFGLATYTAQVKLKEIGIRKVLGASVGHIVKLISAGFIKLVAIAIIIAIPTAWWAMHHWLEGFAYRINISWLVFAFAALLALAIAMATVSFQAIKAALLNPVKSLRSE